MPYSFTSAAAVSSCVESGFDAQSTTCAPPAFSVSISTAVSVVTCRQAPTRMPLSGCSLAKRSRTWRRTGIDCSAHSIRRRPAAACPRSLTSCSAIGVIVLSCYGALRARTLPAQLVGRYWRWPSRPPPQLNPGVVAQGLDAIRLLPREFRLGTTEMTVGRCLLVDGPAEVQVLDDAGGGEVEVAPNHLLEPRVGHLPRPERLDHDRDRVGHTDGVGHLNHGALGESGRHHVLGHVPRHIARRAVDLRRILAREGAAAVRAGAAVGVDDDLAPGEPGIPHRPAGDE